MKPHTLICSPERESTDRAVHRAGSGRTLPSLLVLMSILSIGAAPDSAESKRWTDDELVASCRTLDANNALRQAVQSPSLPGHPPQGDFLDALAWLVAGAPSHEGTLTLEQLDAYIGSQAEAYISLLHAKVENGKENDYPRTRTWKVIQKLTLLRGEMSRPERAGLYRFPAIARAPEGADPWEREHTLGSVQDFRSKVCRGSRDHPVLVKFGNTNCTQCMLFEMTGSVKAFAESPAARGVAEVYKVWWGFEPDASFAGRISRPRRLDDLVKAEGVRSSPTFLVYRNGRQYPCGSAFPTADGTDENLEACLRRPFADKPLAGVCASDAEPESSSGF